MNKLCELLPWRKTVPATTTQRADDFSAHLYLGNMYLALGQFDQAEAEYKRAHALRPSEQTAKLLAGGRAHRAAQPRSSGIEMPIRRAA